MNKIVTGIDVGTNQVRVVIAEHMSDPRQLPRVLGTGYAESRGVKNGYVVSVEEASRSIAVAVAQASKAANVKVKKAYLGVGGIGVDEAFARGETVVERGDSVVSDRDIPRAIAASEKALPPAATQNRKIIHTVPLRYTVDGVRVMGKNPVGMKGARVAVETFFITCLERHITDLASAVEEAGIEVEDVVAAPVAASFVALSKMQKRVGCVLADIGAESLSIILFEDTLPISIKTFPLGAADIAHDIALNLRIPPEDAEQLMRGAVLGTTYPKKKIDDSITRRLTEFFKLIDQHLKKIGKNDLLPSGIILSGGGAAIGAAADIAKTVLRLPSRVATIGDGTTKSHITDNAWAVAYGLTVWGATAGGDIEHHDSDQLHDVAAQVWRWFKKFLP